MKNLELKVMTARRKDLILKRLILEKLTKEDIAKYLNAWELKPYHVCTGVQKNFINFMDNHVVDVLNNKEVDEDYFKKIVSIAIIYRNVENC